MLRAMRGRLIILGVLAALVVPSGAEAHGLSLERGRTAIQRESHGTIHRCWHEGPAVACDVSQHSEGWEVEWTLTARRHGNRIFVTFPAAFEDPHPYSERL